MASNCLWRTATMRPSSRRASTSTPAPAQVTTGARMKTACHGSSPQHRHVQRGLEAVQLAPESVAIDRDVHQAEQGLRVIVERSRQEDHAGAGAPGRSPTGEVAQGRHQASADGQLADGGAFTARNNEAVEPGQLFRLAHLDSFCACALQHVDMLNECALQRQHTNLRHHLTRETVTAGNGMHRLVTVKWALGPMQARQPRCRARAKRVGSARGSGEGSV